jgi:hypothetical protein
MLQAVGGIVAGGGEPHESSLERDTASGEPMKPEPPAPTPDPVGGQNNPALAHQPQVEPGTARTRGDRNRLRSKEPHLTKVHP